jgi:hypothetical protein
VTVRVPEDPPDPADPVPPLDLVDVLDFAAEPEVEPDDDGAEVLGEVVVVVGVPVAVTSATE